MLTLGYKAATEQFGPNELLDYVVEAEQSGFDAIAASDHFHPWRNDDVSTFFVWSWLGSVGSRTKRLSFGTEVTSPILRYNPAVLAEAAATLGVMFPGRFWLGLGTGEALSDAATTGCWPDYPERRARLIEAIEIIRRLWAGEHLTYRGRYFQTRDAHVYLPLKQPVPMIVAASGLISAKMVGHYGDGWMATGASGETESYEKLGSEVDQGALLARRDPATIQRYLEVKVICTKDRVRAMKDARLWAGTEVGDRDKYGIYDPRDLQASGAHISDNALAKAWFISDDPDAHVALAERYINIGFTHLYFHNPSPNQREFIQFYGQHVLPKLHQKSGQATGAQPRAA